MRPASRRMRGASRALPFPPPLKGKPMIVSLLTVAVLVLAGAGSAALYLLPVMIGSARRVPDLGAVAVINVLLGWTLAGWAVALAMSLRSVRPVPPAVQVMQNLPPAPPPRIAPSTARSRLLGARTVSLSREGLKGFRDVVNEVDDLGSASAKAAQSARDTRDTYEPQPRRLRLEGRKRPS